MQKTIGLKKVLIMDSPLAIPLKLPCGAQLPNALFTNIGGSRNTAIGRLAEVTGSDLKNVTAIGYNAKVNASNIISVRRSAPNRPFICPTLYNGSRGTQGESTTRSKIFWNSVQAHYVLSIVPMPATVSQVSPYRVSLQIDQTRDLLT